MKKIIRKTLLGIIIIFVVISSCDMFMSETQSNKKEFTSFNVQGWEADGVAQIISPTITATLPSDADLTQLVIYFTTSPGSSVTVYGRPQVSGRTVNDFTRTVEYMITAENGTTFTYYVDITKEKQEQSDFSLGNNIEKGVNAAKLVKLIL
ncbi:MAG: hypothetical protein B6229_10270 [Spirochaetaceae bacterium 4572_7]|nr:MAG: hypothetical protein B6229_10270 [Spirochaetaceae bacterium 4572_7]